MHLLDLLVLYLLAGALCAIAVWRRQPARPGRWLSLVMTLLLWPLWAPFAWLDPRSSGAPSRAPAPAPSTPLSRRLERQLHETVAAAEGTPFATMLGPTAAQRMCREVRQASSRLAELDKLLQQPNFDRAAALSRVDELLQEAAGDPSASAQLRSARLHLDNVERLARLQVAQQRALGELEQAIFALHSQLVVARYAGSSEEGVGAIVNDLWSRVEGLGEVLDTHPPPPDGPPDGATAADLCNKSIARTRQTAVSPRA